MLQGGADPVAAREQHLGPEHPLVAVSLDILTEMHVAAGNLAEGEATIARAVAMLERTVEPNNVKLARALRTQGEVWVAMDRHQDAANAFRASVGAYADGRPDDYPGLARARGLLGETLMDLGRLQEAEGLLVRSHEVLAEAATAQRLVRLYEAMGEPALAARYRGEAQ